MASAFAAGIDIGSATTKAVVLDAEKNILSSVVKPTGKSVSEIGSTVLDEAVSKAGLVREDLCRVVSTGYGRYSVEGAQAIPEIICHAMGAYTLFPDIRTVIDIGGQDSKVISVIAGGQVGDFAMNDKCAAGTGRYLELVAGIFDLSLTEMCELSLQSSNPCNISSTCAVFAETELIGLRARGEKVEDILAGVNKALAYRMTIMGQSVGFRDKIIFTGGVAYHEGVRQALQARLNKEILVPPNPQIMGALGAAILAMPA